MGNIITANGMKADPDKVTAITTVETEKQGSPLTLSGNGQLPIAILLKSEYRH